MVSFRATRRRYSSWSAHTRKQARHRSHTPSTQESLSLDADAANASSGYAQIEVWKMCAADCRAGSGAVNARHGRFDGE